MKICVFAAGSPNMDDKYLDVAYDLGSQIAKCGHELVYGGGSDGLMGAVSRGARDNGARITAILPKWIDNFCKINDTLDDTVYVDKMDERKRNFLESSDAFVILPGGLGTLDETFEVIALRKLKQHSKPIIFLNCYGFYNPMMEMISGMVNENTISVNDLKVYEVFEDVNEIFVYLDDYNLKF